jgi:beta-glucosidase-like glycosyl hydrolase
VTDFIPGYRRTAGVEVALRKRALVRLRTGELALRATIDIDTISAIHGSVMIELVKRGVVPMALVDASVRRVLQAKPQLGLFEDPYRQSDAERERTSILTPESRALARQAARESVVPLRNEGTVLPMSDLLRKTTWHRSGAGMAWVFRRTRSTCSTAFAPRSRWRPRLCTRMARRRSARVVLGSKKPSVWRAKRTS